MKRLVAASVVLLACAAFAAAEAPEPRALVARAVEAQGGVDTLRPLTAAHGRQKGTFHFEQLAGLRFTSEQLAQFPAQFWYMTKTDPGAEPLVVESALNRDTAWERVNDEKAKNTDSVHLLEKQQEAYVNHVCNLVPLLDEKRFQLSSLPDQSVDGKAAAGVLVRSPGQPDVKLYFEKDNGFLVKLEVRRKDLESGKEFLSEEFFTDYREFRVGAADEQLLRAAKLDVDPAAMVALLKKQSLGADQREKVAQLIKQLGDAKFSVREKAFEELVKQGPAIVPMLRQAAKNPDAEIAKRLQTCIQKIGSTMDTGALSALIRLVAVKKPQGAVEALLDYVPSAPDPAVTREVWRTLATLARGAGDKADPALLKALESKDSARKTAAQAALGREGRKPEPCLRPVGLKVAMKGTQFRDGKKNVDWEVVDLRFFERLDDENFAKP